MTKVSVRYITDDVDPAVAFYVDRLSFDIEMRPGPGFAMLSRGGWNRIQIEVSDLEREVEASREAGASFGNDIVAGRGGSQILLEDPSGNPIELVQPAGA